MMIFRIVAILAAILSCALPATATETKPNTQVSLAMARPSSGMANSSTYDQLAIKKAEFRHFAKDKIKEFNRNLRFNKDRMQITKLADGTYLARYHQIDEASVNSSIRRSQSKASPFVGILSYREKVYEAHGKSPEECRNHHFSLTQIIPNLHIFSYYKGAWH